MTKQEEIREGIARILRENMTVRVVDTIHGKEKEYFFPRGVDALIKYLHSQGVVMKVELPNCCMNCSYIQFAAGSHSVNEGWTGWICRKTNEVVSDKWHRRDTFCPLEDKAGYVAVEPLIEEGK